MTLSAEPTAQLGEAASSTIVKYCTAESRIRLERWQRLTPPVFGGALCLAEEEAGDEDAQTDQQGHQADPLPQSQRDGSVAELDLMLAGRKPYCAEEVIGSPDDGRILKRAASVRAGRVDVGIPAWVVSIGEYKVSLGLTADRYAYQFVTILQYLDCIPFRRGG